MSGFTMESHPPFRPGELAGSDDASASGAEEAELLSMARDLERLARSGDVTPSADFAERVAAAIATEPMPQPATAAGSALRRRRMGQLIAAVRDSWRIAWSGNRPLAMRAQAAALVLVAVLALGSVGGLAAAGAWSALGPHAIPTAVPAVSASPSATPSPSEEPSKSPESSPSSEPSESPEDSPQPTRTSRPTEDHTARPAETPEGTDDHGGRDGGGDSGSDDGSSGSGGSPTETPDGHGGGSDG
jgi:uncharacterized membrane protein YgcG